MSTLTQEGQQAVVAHTIDCDAPPFLPDGWKGVEEHPQGGQLTWDKTAQQDALYIAGGQKRRPGLRGDNLREELKGKPVLNANVLGYLLAHPELIPEEWEKYRVFFWGTIYRDLHGFLCVRCLDWRDGGWRWHYSWLDLVWLDLDPAALRAS